MRREDRQALDKFIVARAREYFDVPNNEQLSPDEEKAIAGLLYTKRLLFHHDNLVAAGIRVSVVPQGSDCIVMGQGDVVHFGHVTEPPADLQPPPPALSTVRSVNEAVNFMPVGWLVTGLPLLVDWMHWLQQVWIPLQATGQLAGNGKRWLREAMHHPITNALIVKHCAPIWSHCFLTRLKKHLTGETVSVNTPETRACVTAINQFMQLDAEPKKLRAAIVAHVDAVLTVMDERVTKKWLFDNCDDTDDRGNKWTDYIQ